MCIIHTVSYPLLLPECPSECVGLIPIDGNPFATLFWSPMYALHGLVVHQYNVKLCCPFSSWFAQEANVANNNND